MLKQRGPQIQLFVRLFDLILCAGAFSAAFGLRNTILLPGQSSLGFGPGSWESLTWILGASLVIHLVLYPYLGFYQSLRMKSLGQIVAMVVKATVIEFFVLGSLVFFIQAKETPRYFFGAFLAFNALLLISSKLSARVLLGSIRRRGYNYRRVWIVGTGPNAAGLIHTLKLNAHWGYLAAAVLRDADNRYDGETFEGVPVLGNLSDLEALVRKHPVDDLYFAPERLDPETFAHEVALSQKLGIAARFSLGMLTPPGSKIDFGTLDQIPTITYFTTLHTPLEALCKRLLDVAVSIVGLLITAALYPWISSRIRRESPGPVIFKQLRVGENGRRFRCYKFRTMSLDAEARKAELAAQNQMSGPVFKIANDPRIFPFGAFLRRTSLDELPQFFNILRGDMSVVGTRPPTPDEVEKYPIHYRRRLSIRPGLTGLWQVSGRNQITNFDEILALDLRYIDQWSIWLDVRIIAKTIWITLIGRGAY